MVNYYGDMQRRNFAHLQECTQYQTTQDKCLHAVNYNTPVPSSTAYTFTTLYKSSSRRILPHVMLWLAGSPLNMMWSTVQRCASSESCLGHERIYKIPRLHCHGSCHFGSPLLNESAIQFPHGDNWTTAFLLSVPLNLPTSALLLPLRRTTTVVHVLVPIRPQPTRFSERGCDRRGWAMQRNPGTWKKFLVHNLSSRAVPAMATLSATASLTLSSKSFANALPLRKSWTESFIQSAVSLSVCLCLSLS